MSTSISTATFECAGTLTYDVSGPATFIFSLHCRSSRTQNLREESFTASRTDVQLDPPENIRGNRFTRIVAETAGPLEVAYRATADVTTRKIPVGDLTYSSPATIPPGAFNYLFPSRYVPSDIMRDAAADLFGHLPGTYAQVVAIEDWIHENVVYTLGSSGEHTTASHTFDSGQGVCRDFAHLGIALCRALAIPARYLTAYAHDLELQDFHACFEAHIGGHWLLFDATRLAPLNALVRIATARDAATAPVATIYGDPGNSTVQASCRCTSNDFTPVSRDDLRTSGEALSFS